MASRMGEKLGRLRWDDFCDPAAEKKERGQPFC